ncbi:MAG: amidase [Candidatus Binatia bacterium]
MRPLTEVAQLIASRAVSPVELTEAMLARIAALDGKLYSYLLVTADLARAQARHAEQEIRAGRYRGKLHGIPIGIKDLVHQKGVPTTCASTIMRDFRPDVDATVITKLEAAGAVMLGKLNLTEFALYGYHPEYEYPRNPWNLDYWAGASSSGSGAATAAGLCFGAIGTDTGGSIRFPSGACGIVGIKPTFGKVSRYGVFPLADTLDHVGPMARTVADAAAMLQVMEGWDERDPTTRSDPGADYEAALAQGVKGLRIGIDREYCTTDTDPRMTEAAFRAVELLAGLGAEIVEVRADGLADCCEYWMKTCAVDALVGHQHFYPSRRAEYGPVFRSLLDYGAEVSAADYARGERQRQTTRGILDRVFTQVDTFLCPATPAPPMLQAEFPPQQVAPPEALAPLVHYAAPFNYTGAPSLTLPNGFTAEGLPTAMQFIGRHGDEATIIRAGAAYERATDWHKRRPRV